MNTTPSVEYRATKDGKSRSYSLKRFRLSSSSLVRRKLTEQITFVRPIRLHSGGAVSGLYVPGKKDNKTTTSLYIPTSFVLEPNMIHIALRNRVGTSHMETATVQK